MWERLCLHFALLLFGLCVLLYLFESFSVLISTHEIISSGQRYTTRVTRVTWTLCSFYWTVELKWTLKASMEARL